MTFPSEATSQAVKRCLPTDFTILPGPKASILNQHQGTLNECRNHCRDDQRSNADVVRDFSLAEMLQIHQMRHILIASRENLLQLLKVLSSRLTHRILRSNQTTGSEFKRFSFGGIWPPSFLNVAYKRCTLSPSRIGSSLPPYFNAPRIFEYKKEIRSIAIVQDSVNLERAEGLEGRKL